MTERIDRAKLIRTGAVLASLLMISLLVMTGSRAAFTATTNNAANTWQAGTVALSDDDSGSMLFAAADMVTGDPLSNCIEVSFGGQSAGADVRLYSATAIPAGDLAENLNLTIQVGTGGSFQATEDGSGSAAASCTGFTALDTPYVGTVADFAANNTTWANTAVQSWTTATTGDVRVYRFIVELDAATPAAQAGATSTAVDFTWEVQG